jgi:hypothetical protein
VFTFQHRFHVHDFSAQKNVWLDSETLVRIPFFFGVSMLYAYLAQQAKSEKARADQAEQAQIVRPARFRPCPRYQKSTFSH